MKIRVIIDEEWKPLVYKNVKPMYKISNYGRIRNINTGKLLSVCFSEKGYAMVELMNTLGKSHTFKLHRIVGMMFLPLPDFNDGNYWTVNHIDGRVKEDCSIYNLEWLTFTDNIRESFRTGLNKPMRGETNGNNKYSEKTIRKVCRLLELGYKCPAIIKVINNTQGIQLSKYIVHDLKRHKTWRHISKEYNI